MNQKSNLKRRAIWLRTQGKTYSEILEVISVAKSTLSLWFHGVGLAQSQKQRITQKRIEGQKKGARARREQRVQIQESIWLKAEKEIGMLSRRELWLVGIALYWAEGSKEKNWHPGEGVRFSNSDPRMLRLFLRWLNECVGIFGDIIKFEIYLHESKKYEIGLVRKFWSKELGVPSELLDKVYFKKNKLKTNRRNTGLLYNGLVRVSIAKSSTLLRRIEGWIRGIDIARSSNGRTRDFES